MAKGIDPFEKKEAQHRAEAEQKANTFAVVVTQFLTRHVCKLRSAADVEAVVKRELLPR
jgi:hypothetical protein